MNTKKALTIQSHIQGKKFKYMIFKKYSQIQVYNVILFVFDCMDNPFIILFW